MNNKFNNFKFVWKYTKDDKGYLFGIIILNLIGIGLSIIMPILSAKIIVSLTSNDFKQIILIAMVILGVDGINYLLSYLVNRLSQNLYRNSLYRLEVELGSNVLKLDNKSLDDNGSGVFIKRLTDDTSRIADFSNVIIGMSSDIVTYIGIFAAIFIVNKYVFIYTVTTTIILYIIQRIKSQKKKEDDKVSRKSSEKVYNLIGELVRGARDIKMLNSENDFINELSFRIDDANKKRIDMKRRSWKYKLAANEILALFNFILIILLVILMQKEIILPTAALILFNYSNRLTWFVNVVDNLLDYTKDFSLSCERVYDILGDNVFTKEKFGTVHLDKINGDFEFKDVVFGYTDKKILNKLNFKVNANETVAFVGKSGEGKTTIFNLLCKMYDINSGSIMIDGHDINTLDKDSIRGNITIISQNPYIFNMSIKDNFRLVKANLTDKEMKEACKIACLDDFIDKLPLKYDTIIGEGGVNLSGGQKQRLAIARALVQKTEIILFDEATSALDNETQKKIQDAIDNMKNEYTILIIAHRLSTIKNASRIMFLSNGKIICEGTHSYLLKNCPEYKELYDSEIKNNK